MVVSNSLNTFKFLKLIVLWLASLASSVDITYYVTYDADYGGLNDGSFADPFEDIISALDSIQLDPPTESTSYTFLLAPSNDYTFVFSTFDDE